MNLYQDGKLKPSNEKANVIADFLEKDHLWVGPEDGQIPELLRKITMREHVQREEDRKWTMAEVKAVLKSLPTGKSKRPSGYPYELWKMCAYTPNGLAEFTELINGCLEQGKVPQEFIRMQVVSAWKGRWGPQYLVTAQGDANYRFFGLTETASKALGRLVAARMTNCARPLLRNSTFGFLKSIGCPEALLVLRRVLEHYQGIVDETLDPQVLSIDFANAFPSVGHGALACMLKALGFEGNLGKLAKAMLVS